jgi:hypothetical protein
MEEFVDSMRYNCIIGMPSATFKGVYVGSLKAQVSY